MAAKHPAAAGTARTRKLEKGAWQKYFDDFSRKFVRDDVPERTTVQVLSGELGAQLAASRAGLVGLTYDPREDAVEVAFETLLHRIHHPREIEVVEKPDGFPESIRVVVDDLDLRVKKGMEEVLTLTHSAGAAALLEGQGGGRRGRPAGSGS